MAKANLFDGLDEDEDVPVVRAPFGYCGSKSQGLKHILPMLPYRRSYVEVFGGSGVVLLNRRPSTIDVYNDRFGGVVTFYRCLRNEAKYLKMMEWLEATVNSKEEYIWCRDTWENCTDDVERACRWFYSMHYSFGNKGTAWGRKVTSTPLAVVKNRFPSFSTAHRRLAGVQIENASWEKILNDYDHPEAVFYLDPPYIATDGREYTYGMNHDDHRRMLNTIFRMKGFVALSGFANTLYDNFSWDDRISWKQTCSMAGNANNEGNNKAHLKGLESYHSAEEVLWIKEAE